MNKHHAFFTLVVLTFAACQNKVTPEVEEPTDIVFEYPMEITFNGINDAHSRTVLNNESILWETGDEIRILWGENRYNRAVVQPYDYNTKAEFKTTVEPSDSYYGIYPFEADASVTGGNIRVSIPASQSGVFGAANLAVAKADKDNNMIFRHIAGYIEFTTDRTGVLEITGGSSNSLSGDITITGFDNDGRPQYNVEGKSSSISVDIKASGTYYIAVLPDARFDYVALTLTEDGKELYALSANTIKMTPGKLVGIGNITDRFRSERQLGATLESFKIEEFNFGDQNTTF